MKKNFARIIALIVAIMMVAALFAGCKSDKDDKDDKDDKKETATNAEGNNGGKDDSQGGSQQGANEGNNQGDGGKTQDKPADQNPSANLSGTYKVIKVNGVDIADYFTSMAEMYDETLEELCDEMDIPINDLGSVMVFTFYADGTAVVTNAISEESFDLTWTLDGDTFTATDEDGNTNTGIISGNTFDMVFDGETLTFGK